jgi:putative transposase
VRTVDGESEVSLRTYDHFADRDQLGRLALERILAGVSTRKYRKRSVPGAGQVSAGNGAPRLWAVIKSLR